MVYTVSPMSVNKGFVAAVVIEEILQAQRSLGMTYLSIDVTCWRGMFIETVINRYIEMGL